MANIRHELIIGASAEKVYHAITTESGLSSWWTPATTMKADNILRFPFGPTYFKEMKVTTLNPFDEIKWTCIAGAEEWIGTTLSFRLDEGNQQTISNAHPEILGQLQQNNNTNVTILRFQHDGWKKETPMHAECNYTWAQFLRSLKLYCETGRGIPWPNQHSHK